MRIRFTPEASADLDAIADYISEHDVRAAVRWGQMLRESCARLATATALGVVRAEIRPGLRVFPVRKYMILYRRDETGVEIVRIVHAARQWSDLV